MLSATKRLRLPQESTSALSWLWGPCSDVALGNRSLILRSVRMNWTKSWFCVVWFQVRASATRAKCNCSHLYSPLTALLRSHCQWPELGHVPLMISLWHWISHGAKNLENVTVLPVVSGLWHQYHTLVLCWLLNKNFSKDCTKLSVQYQVPKFAYSSLNTKDYCKSFAKWGSYFSPYFAYLFLHIFQ